VCAFRFRFRGWGGVVDEEGGVRYVAKARGL